MKNSVYVLLSFLFVACTGGNNSKISPELADKISKDSRLTTIKEKSEDLICSGLTAGDSYVEVWIRDLNTFIETSCKVGEPDKVKEALITFFKFQGEDGNIPDGYTTQNTSSIPYEFIHSDLAPEFVAHKNTVETDQESSLIQAIKKYIDVTGDKSILKETVAGRNVEQRMADAMQFLLKHRLNEEYGLLWGATTSDWGDVQPEHQWGVYLDSLSHLCIDIYDNAMFVVAMNNYIEMADSKEQKEYWKKTSSDIKANVRKHLWDNSKQKYIPHIYLNGSPFPDTFDENEIHYHGGTTIAIEAGMLSKEEILAIYKQMQANVKLANAQTIGLTLYPAYPNGFFENPWMYEYNYQNGGDWTWFGGRMVQQLIANGYYEEAYEALTPMLDLVIKHDGFYEWWSPSGEPMGSAKFRGAAGVLWKAIVMFEELLPSNSQKS